MRTQGIEPHVNLPQKRLFSIMDCGEKTLVRHFDAGIFSQHYIEQPCLHFLLGGQKSSASWKGRVGRGGWMQKTQVAFGDFPPPRMKSADMLVVERRQCII